MERLVELKEQIQNIEVIDYQEAYYDLYNTTIDFMNEVQEFDLEYLFDDIITYCTAEEIAKAELEKGGLIRLYYFLGEANMHNDIFKINGYGNLEDITGKDLENLKEEILEIINDKIKEMRKEEKMRKVNEYEILKGEIQKAYDNFPFGFAFSDKQLEEMKEKLGVKENSELFSIGNGGFIRKTDSDKFEQLVEECDNKMKKAIAEDKTGEGFIKDMFEYELGNHEYCITYELDDTLEALNLTREDVLNDKRLLHGLKLAKESYLATCNW